MKLSLKNSPPQSCKTPCIVVGITEDGPFPPAAAAIDKSTGGLITRLLASKDISASSGKTTLLHAPPGIAAERVLVVGFGKMQKITGSSFDRACVTAGKVLRNHPLRKCHICVQEVEISDRDFSWRLRQAALAFHRANYLYTATKKLQDDAPAPMELASFQADKKYQNKIDQASGIARGYDKARELGDLPPNIATPAYLAQEAREIAREFDSVALEILDEDEMAKLGMNALLGVSRGSANPACLIVLKYSKGNADQQPVVLVGKGITFDSGGLSLKSPENMTQMKYDVCGAASVMGTFLACVSMSLEINVVAVIAAAENMPDGNAYRPGDVVTSMAGKTIEVLNTDAEGRLVLCDAITYSARFNPRVVIDVATLTGACVVALGHHASGLISNDDALANALLDAGEDIVDRAWRMPLWDEYQSQLDSPFADMQNVGGMSAGMITAACFLSRFTEDMRWAHLDTAGSAWKWSEKEGATGRPVGLLSSYLISAVEGETAK